MFLTYFIILLLSTFIRLMHWPGGDILLVISPIFPFLDIFIQIIRRKRNVEHTLRILGSVTLFGVSIYLVFKLLFWEGGPFIFFFFLATLITFLIVFAIRKPKVQKRFITVFAISILSIGFYFTSAYRIYEIYTIKNPFQPKDELISERALFKLAWFYHLAGKNQEAKSSIQRAISQIEKECSTGDYASHNGQKEYCEDRKELLEKELFSLENGLPMNYFVINELY